MNEWLAVKLKDLVTLKQGFAVNKKSNHYISKTGIPLLKISDLFSGTETLFVKNTIPKQFLVFEDEIIYSRTGNSLGHAFMGRKGAVYNNCFKVIPNEKVHAKFLYQLLNTNEVRETAQSLATGTAQPDLNHDAFKSIKIQLPPLPTQKKIAKILSNYDDHIENNLKRIKLLEESARLTYKEWFLRFRIDGEQLEIDSETGLPFGWETQKLKDSGLEFIDGDRGSNYPKQNEFFGNEYCLFLNTGNVTKNGFDFTTTQFITKEKDEILRKGKLKTKDIVLTTRGTIGNIVLYNDKIQYKQVRINSGMLIIRSSKSKFDDVYLYQYFTSLPFQYQVRSFSTGSAQPQIPISILKSIKIVYPGQTILDDFYKLIKPKHESVQILHNQNQLLKEARDILLPRLMTGMIDVDELEVAV